MIIYLSIYLAFIIIINFVLEVGMAAAGRDDDLWCGVEAK